MQQRIDVDNASIADSSLEGSSIAQTDHNYALKRFLLDTDTIFNHEPEIPISDSSKTVYEEDSSPVELPPNSVEILPIGLEIEHQRVFETARADPEKCDDAVLGLSLRLMPEHSAGDQKDKCGKSCIIPEIVATVEGLEEFYRKQDALFHPFFTPRISKDSLQRICPSTLSSLHLYGHDASFLTMPCSNEATAFVAATSTRKAQKSNELTMHRGDVIRRLYRFNNYRSNHHLNNHWSKGSLGQNTGIYPDGHVESINFESAISCQLVDVMRGQPILDLGYSDLLFLAFSMIRVRGACFR